jgi:MipA family protein
MNHVSWLLLPPAMILTAPLPAMAQDHLKLGAGVLVTPAYQGSAETRIIPVPLIDAEAGPFFISTTDGAGAKVRLGNVTVGASATYVIGYRRSDVPGGLSRLSDALGARLFASVAIGHAITSVGVTKAVAGGTRGVTADASVTYPLELSKRVLIAPSIGISWADRRHNDHYFGLSDRRGIEQNLSGFRGRAGFKDVSATVTGRYAVGKRIDLTAMGGFVRLLPPVSDGPLVKKRGSVSGLLGISYRF